ncbi:MAG: NifU family protein [Acidimicrobiales bacterium]
MATSDAPIVIVSEKARTEILAMRSAEAEGDTLALAIAVTGHSGNEYAYELTFEPLGDLPNGVQLYQSGDLPVAIGEDDEHRLRGSVLDLVDPTGLVLRNPNRPPPPVVPGSLELTGTVEERLAQLLEGEINPMLASHGGFAAMDRVEDGVAYLSMGGGCQGCGLAQMTLTEGIKTSVLEQIPEITTVVDITDHGAGTNPFYDPV